MGYFCVFHNFLRDLKKNGGWIQKRMSYYLGEKEKKLMHLFCLLHCRQILGIHSSTRSLHNTQANIRKMFFDQRSPQHLELGVSQWHRHADTWTSNSLRLSAQRANSLRENIFFLKKWLTTVLTMMDTDKAGSRVKRGHNSRSIDRHLLQNSDGCF